MQEISFLSAFVGGLLTFFAPCTFPLIPAYLGFLSGDLGETAHPRRRIMSNALLFVTGFTAVFLSFGLLSGALGTFLILHRLLLSQIGGAVVIMMGLQMLLRIPLPSFFGARTFPLWALPGKPLSALLLGLFFGLGWSPCLGPILGTILLLAGTSGSAGTGALLLFVYSFGLAMPFLLVALLSSSVLAFVVTGAPYMTVVERVAGGLLVVIGSMLLFGTFGLWNVWLGVEHFGPWYGRLMEYM